MYAGKGIDGSAGVLHDGCESSSSAASIFVFLAPESIATLVFYDVLGRLVFIGNTKRLVREGLLHEQRRLAETFTEVMVVR